MKTTEELWRNLIACRDRVPLVAEAFADVQMGRVSRERAALHVAVALLNTQPAYIESPVIHLGDGRSAVIADDIPPQPKPAAKPKGK